MGFIVLLFARDGYLNVYYPELYEPMHLPFVFSILIVITWIFHKKDYPFKFPLQLWLMFFFLIAITLSRTVTHSYPLVNKQLDEYFRMFILAFLIINLIRTKTELSHIVWVLIGINLFLFLYHYYQYRTGWASIFHVPALWGLNRNGFAATLASCAALSYGMMRASPGKPLKIIAFVSLVFFCMGVILTDSRGGFLTLAVTLGLMILFDKKKLAPALLALIIIVSFGSRISDKYFNRLNTIREYETDVSAMGRIATNHAAINMLKQHPVFGIGAGNFPLVFLEYTPPEMMQWVEPEKNIHNIVLQVLSETGLFGGFLFLLLIFTTLISLYKSQTNFFKTQEAFSQGYVHYGIAFSALAYFTAMQFGQGGYYGYLYIFIPLSVAAIQISAQNSPE